MKAFILWLAAALTVSAQLSDIWPLVDTQTRLTDPRIIPELYGMVNERAMACGVAPLPEEVLDGFITTTKMQVIRAKIDEMLATGKWVARDPYAENELMEAWYRLTDEDRTNWVAWLPRMQPVESFEALNVGITRMVTTNVWGYRSNEPPAEAWWTLWPDRPLRAVMARYVWRTNAAWVAACMAADESSPTPTPNLVSHADNSGYWVDDRFVLVPDGPPRIGSAYNILEAPDQGDGFPPARGVPLAGRFYSTNQFPWIKYRASGWGPDTGVGSVYVDPGGWGYLTNQAFPVGWNYDTQAVAYFTGNTYGYQVPRGGEVQTTQVVFFATTKYPDLISGFYRPSRFLRATGGSREGDVIEFLWDEDAVAMYSGPSAFTSTDASWASLLFAECLDECFTLLNAMRWTTTTTYGWMTNSVKSVDEATERDVDLDLADDGSPAAWYNPELSAWWQAEPPWDPNALTGAYQSAIGGMMPVDDGFFGWDYPGDDSPDESDWRWPSDGEVPWPSYFFVEGTVPWQGPPFPVPEVSEFSNPTLFADIKWQETWACVARYSTLNPEYFDDEIRYSPVEEYEPGLYMDIVGRWFVGGGGFYPHPEYGDSYAAQSFYSGVTYRVTYDEVLSKPWVEPGFREADVPNLPNFEVDFYLYATNGWWTDAPEPMTIPVKRQTVASGANFSVVTGAVESAREAAFSMAEPTVELDYSLEDSPVATAYAVDMPEAWTNAPLDLKFRVPATAYSTSFWFCVTNEVYLSGPPCQYTESTNWVQVTTNWWRVPDTIVAWTMECANVVLYADVLPPDPEPVFTFQYVETPFEMDPPGDCLASNIQSVVMDPLDPALETNHTRIVEATFWAEQHPACADGWMLLRVKSLQTYRWWSVYQTNCVVHQWEPVIRWDVEGGFQYLLD